MQLVRPDNNHPPLSIIGLILFFTLLLTSLTISGNNLKKLFTDHHGRSHRLTGLFHLFWLAFGAVIVIVSSKHFHHNNYYPHYWHNMTCLMYDIILGLSGIITTLTAASSFPHKHVVNQPGESGTLSKYAMVTQDEMMEHSFYQGVNLCQALFLHVGTWGVILDSENNDDESTTTSLVLLFAKRFLLLFLVTLPWTIRKRFPVNSFSDNWKRKRSRSNSNVQHDNTITNNNHHRHHEKLQANGEKRVGTIIQVGAQKGSSKSLWLINGMYRFKKWQYIFYKHVILHGLNISVALSISSSSQQQQQQPDKWPLPLTSEWRTFWLLLNTSYVMEFFLQTLVKRQILTQRKMMILNALLMTLATIASMERNVLGQVRIEAALISLFLNFYNRGHDVLNTMMTFFMLSKLIW